MDICSILNDIRSDRRKKVILDTDAYNEIDDQFAIAWSVLENGRGIELLSINAAPFLNSRSVSPEDGMEKSYDEIQKLLRLIEESGYETGVRPADVPVYRGSRGYLPDRKTPLVTDASQNIVKAVLESKETVYIVALGAITNVASAILMQPEITENMAVIWLGGNAWHWPNTREFNMVQDVPAAQVIFDSRVPFIQIPCAGVCDRLATSIPELSAYLEDKGKLCDYLFSIVKGYTSDPFCWSKVIWDISAVAVLLARDGLDIVTLPAPVLTDDCHYAFDCARRPMALVRSIDRDTVFRKLFKILSQGMQ